MLMKAQDFFGGTKPKDKATKVRQVGNSGSVTNMTGNIKFVNSKQPRPAAQPSNIKWVNSKQVGSTGRAK